MPSSDVPWAKVEVTAEAVKEMSDLAEFAGRLQTELDATRAAFERLQRRLQEQHDLHALRANAEKTLLAELERLREEATAAEKMMVYQQSENHVLRTEVKRHAESHDCRWCRAALEEK